MNYQQIINEYMEFLWKMFQYDMDIFSKPWIYWVLLIPAMGYFGFFMIKWVVLTTPLWMPLVIIVNTIGGIFRKKE
jgi:hypothetical protein